MTATATATARTTATAQEAVPGLVTCTLLLAVIDVSLRVLGFARVMRMARLFSRVRGSSSDRAMIDATLHRVLQATALYPGRSQCLEHSVAVFVLLRRRGFDVELRLGVQTYPFAAHAWVELDGASVTESQEVVSRFVLLPEVAV